MKNGTAAENPATRRMLLRLCVAACAVVSVVAWPQHAHAQKVSPPPVPPAIEAPGGNEAYLEGHAVGTQNYICLPSGSGFAWTLFGPQATLFNDKDGQVTTHFLSPNPFENGTPRPAWQHSQDTSTIWGQAIASSNDADFVAPGAIPWLLLRVVGAQDGPKGGHKFARATFLHRLNTDGGTAPSTGCAQSSDLGQRAFVPYTADYFFYK